MKIIQITKNIIYLVLGTLILIFNQFCFANIALVVSTIMLLNAIEDIATWSIRGLAKEGTRFFDALILLILALVLILVRKNLEKSLIIFGVWMILKEGKELTECATELRKHKYVIVDALESIFIIVMSILLIIQPNEHHAHIHVFILGIELLIEVLFYYIYQYLDKLTNKQNTKETTNGREEE